MIYYFNKYDDIFFIKYCKVTLDSHFINDMGLDSLDQVEVVMAVEEDFQIDIPDKVSQQNV